LINDFINLIYPEICYSCNSPLLKGEKLICVKCKINLPFTNFHLEKENPITQKFIGRVKINHAFSFLHFVKKGKVQKLLHQLKYKGKEDIGLLLGKWYGNILLESGLNSFDIIAPVPMHKNKLKLRGYNQVDSFCRGLSESLYIPWEPNLLLKINNTDSQTKKGRFDRWKNVATVFVFNNSFDIENKKILLTDDVVTTGATIEACANLLVERKAEVSIATIAHAK